MEKTATWTWPDRYSDKENNIAEERSRDEWYQEFRSDIRYEMDSYIKLITPLPKLMPFLEAKGPINYHDLVAVFNLDIIFRYDCNNSKRADISLEEILLKALDYFPDEKNIPEKHGPFPFLLILIRIYNAQGRFKEAQKLLQENQLDLYTENQFEFFNASPTIYQQIAFYESCICKMAITRNYQLWEFPNPSKLTEEECKRLGVNDNEYFGSKENKDSPSSLPFNMLGGLSLLPFLDLVYWFMRPKDKLVYLDKQLYLIFSYLKDNNIQQNTCDYIMISIIVQIKCLNYIHRPSQR